MNSQKDNMYVIRTIEGFLKLYEFELCYVCVITLFFACMNFNKSIELQGCLTLLLTMELITYSNFIQIKVEKINILLKNPLQNFNTFAA